MCRLSYCTLLLIAASCYLVYCGQAKVLQVSQCQCVSVCVCVSVCAEQRKVAKGQRQASLTSSHLISFICLSRSEASAARPHCWLKVFGHGQIQLQQLSRLGLKSRLKTLHNLAVAATAVACGIWQLQFHSFSTV